MTTNLIRAISGRKSGWASKIFILAVLVLVGAHRGSCQWTQSEGLETGSVSCLASDGTTLYAGTPDQGVFRSDDAGASWRPIRQGLTDSTIYALASQDGYLLAGSYGSGVFVSTDRGEHWTTGNGDGLADPYVYSVAIRDTIFFAGTAGGVFRSSDRGVTWSSVNVGIPEYAIKVLAVIDSTLFAGTLGGGIFRTTDSGNEWFAANVGLSNSYLQTFAKCDGFIFAGTYGGLFVSDDGGSSWRSAYTGNLPASVLYLPSTETVRTSAHSGQLSLPRGSGSMANPSSILKDKAVHALAVHGNRLFVGSWMAGVLLTEDYGKTWRAVNEGLPEIPVYSIVSNGTNLIAGTYYNGIWRRPLAEMESSTLPHPETGPESFTLQQNYPNPFNQTTLISYTITGDGGQGSGTTQVRLAVYDILGRQVSLLVDEQESPGAHKVEFDGAGLVSGLYVYALAIGKTVQTRTMILLK